MMLLKIGITWFIFTSWFFFMRLVISKYFQITYSWSWTQKFWHKTRRRFFFNLFLLFENSNFWKNRNFKFKFLHFFIYFFVSFVQCKGLGIVIDEYFKIWRNGEVENISSVNFLKEVAVLKSLGQLGTLSSRRVRTFEKGRFFPDKPRNT